MNPDNLRLIDAIGHAHSPAQSDARIVSLVPSLTELLFALGLASRLVGRTGFCVHPKPEVKRIPKVGGTKDFDLEKIRTLLPTHLIVNVDENPRERVEMARAFVPNVIVTHPMGPLENPALYGLLGRIFGAEAEAERLARDFQASYRGAVEATSSLPRERVLYVIWKDPWMTISRDTYIARTLESVGWDQIDVASPDRYPVLHLESVLGRVDRILLSSEPYAFRPRDVEHVKELMNVTSPVPGHGARAIGVSLIDAEMTSWYGSRAIKGMRHLALIRNAPAR